MSHRRTNVDMLMDRGCDWLDLTPWLAPGEATELSVGIETLASSSDRLSILPWLLQACSLHGITVQHSGWWDYCSLVLVYFVQADAPAPPSTVRGTRFSSPFLVLPNRGCRFPTFRILGA